MWSRLFIRYHARRLEFLKIARKTDACCFTWPINYNAGLRLTWYRYSQSRVYCDRFVVAKIDGSAKSWTFRQYYGDVWSAAKAFIKVRLFFIACWFKWLSKTNIVWSLRWLTVVTNGLAAEQKHFSRWCSLRPSLTLQRIVFNGSYCSYCFLPFFDYLIAFFC